MRKPNTPKKPFALSIRWQLMLFIGGITLFTLLLVWGIITYALAPQYNRNIRNKLDAKAAAITALIDQSDSAISNRSYLGLTLNEDFWDGVSETFQDKKINVDSCCVDFSDTTLRCLKAYESMYLPAAREHRCIRRRVRLQCGHPCSHSAAAKAVPER